MKANEVQIGQAYIVKVSGKLAKVRLESVSQYGGWNGRNLETGREVRIRTAAKLRRGTDSTIFDVKCPKCSAVYKSHYPQSDLDSGKVNHRRELCGATNKSSTQDQLERIQEVVDAGGL